jgi:hypothetical protein
MLTKRPLKPLISPEPPVKEELIKKLIFLSSPYSHKDTKVRKMRFDLACKWAAKLTRENRLVFSLVAHSHPLLRYGLPRSFEFWRDFTETMIGRCDELWVLKVKGWERSNGMAVEIKIARSLGKPIIFLDLKKWRHK